MSKISEEIENASRLTYEAGQGKDVLEELATNRARLSKIKATQDDITQAVVYLTSIYATMLQRNATADAARFELLVRVLGKENILSKNVVASMADQLDAITDEEIKRESEKD